MNAEQLKSLETLNDFLAEFNIKPLSEQEGRDWVAGGETDKELYQMAVDLRSEEDTARCEAKNAWRYEV